MSETTLAASNAANNYTLKNNEDGSFAIKKATTDVLTISATGVVTPVNGISLGGNETLSVYDEGTWTPTVAFSGGTGISATGKYTRIGRLVLVNIIVTGTAMTCANATSTVTLPPSLTPIEPHIGAVSDSMQLQNGEVWITTDGKVYMCAITSTDKLVMTGMYNV